VFSRDQALCRLKLARLPTLFSENPARVISPHGELTAVPNLTELLPGQSPNRTAAAAAVLGSLPPEVLRQFDEAFQAEVLDQQGGLWGLVCEPTDPLRETWRRPASAKTFGGSAAAHSDLAVALRRELHARARRLILEALQPHDAASLFLEAHARTDQAQQALLTQAQAALPRLRAPCGAHQIVLALPLSPAGRALHELALPALAGAPLTLMESTGDIICCQEAAGYALEQVAEALGGDQAVCADLAQRVLTRTDVAWATSTCPPIG
jgi:hypothetical protein